MKKTLSLLISCAFASSLMAESLKVESFDFFGPYPVKTPLMVDSVDVNGKKFNAPALSSHPLKINLTSTPSKLSPSALTNETLPYVGILSFDFDNEIFAKPNISISGLDNYAIYLDGKKTDSDNISISPATHNVAIRFLATSSLNPDSIAVEINSADDAAFSLRTDGKRCYTLDDVLHGRNVSSAAISPDGKYLITTYSTGLPGGESSRSYRLTSLSDGKILKESSDYMAWMPKGSRIYSFRRNVAGTELVATDAASGAEQIICAAIPEDSYPIISPDESMLILQRSKEGRKEDGKVYEIIQPEDRQPGWRDRSYLSLYDIASGIETPLTFGHRNVFLNDISADSRKLLISVSESRLEKRPTTLNTLLSLDLDTMKADTIVAADGFITRALFSPDASKIVIAGAPEALGGIGLNLPEGRIPNMTETELFLFDTKSRKTTPLTRDFNPSVTDFSWSHADGMIYLNAEDRDQINLFRINPASGVISRISVPEQNVGGFSLPHHGKEMVWFGESASSPRALYSLDTKTLKSRLIDSPKAAQLADVSLGECRAWDFVNSRGDTICGRFYLPPNFDPAKKYPMIVNYYGGCSPSSISFESRYPHNAYAAQGYVVYVVNPSGATGFGQEFASRHVNTAGEGVAQDIIEGTRKFCEEHPFVDASKIGCIGASYGGFMTQYLQTVTDIFAAAISHAGISDHTSYWGEGYWGYSYSEVSMANSYPWSDPDLYVKQSPLYNADKIHTPILFLHGDADNNVPVGESIQMFTALKLLGRDTAFVAVADQDHHILDYDKRKKWQDTIFAWFARHLKGQPQWWDALYPPTPL